MSQFLPVSKGFNPRKSHPFSSNRFKRRSPSQYFYIPIECPLGRNCEDGLCALSHTKLEVIFHPVLHRTKRCGMAVLNICVFSQRCAFFHNSRERISSHLVWLNWHWNWSLWDSDPKSFSQRFNLDIDISNKFFIMLQNRIQLHYILNKQESSQNNQLNHEGSDTYYPTYVKEAIAYNAGDDAEMMNLEKRLDAILELCTTPETTASSLTPKIKQYLELTPYNNEMQNSNHNDFEFYNDNLNQLIK
uniref:C3H1-type domain-containing protein n=1 Tax=Theileria annulata TaxID=5874 RepID=A0A3B0N5C3_THEAN